MTLTGLTSKTTFLHHESAQDPPALSCVPSHPLPSPRSSLLPGNLSFKNHLLLSVAELFPSEVFQLILTAAFKGVDVVTLGMYKELRHESKGAHLRHPGESVAEWERDGGFCSLRPEPLLHTGAY